MRFAAIAEPVAITPIQTLSFWLQRIRKEAPAVQRVQRESLYYFLFLFSPSSDLRVGPRYETAAVKVPQAAKLGSNRDVFQKVNG